MLHYGGRGGNATPEGTDQVQPRGASSSLPSGTRAQRSVLPGRGKAASIAQRRRMGQRAQGTQKEAGRGTDRRGKKGEARQANEGKCGRPAGQAVHAATNRGGRQQAPTPAWQPAGRAGSPHSLPGPAGSPPAVQASHIHGLHVYRQTLRLRSSACSRPPQQRARDASAAPVPTLRAWHHRHTGNKHHRHHMLTPQSLCRLLSLLFSWHV